MKRSINILFMVSVIILLITLITPLELSAESRGLKVTVKDSENKETEIELYKESYALVIGNGNYKDWGRLKGALSDANDVAKALEYNGFEVTLKKDLTKEQFDDEFSKFSLEYGKNEDARLLFYYAGHGYTRYLEMTREDWGYQMHLTLIKTCLDSIKRVLS